jgi:hypothetical protein
VIHGGQSPIYNAQIYVFDTGHAGYPGTTVAGNVSTIGSTGNSYSGIVNGVDYGNFVLTDSGGNYTIPSFTCTAGDGVYVVSVGGQAISGTPNSAATLMAAVGVCPATGGAAALGQSTPVVNINEASTVAMAYALGGFTAAGYDFSHISTTLSNITALQNAFALSTQLVSPSSVNGANVNSSSLVGATFDQGKINLLANVLADCVNSGGTSTNATPCYTFFQYASSNGAVGGAGGGTVPQDTASAMINITHNVLSNVSNIFALATNAYAPFTPTTTTATSDLSLTVAYSSAANMYDPYKVVIDSSGNVYAVSQYGSGGTTTPKVARISPTSGVIGSMALPSLSAIAIDKSNNVFFATTSSSPVVTEYAQGTSSSVLGTAVSGSPFTFTAESGKTIDQTNGLAIGPSNDMLLCNLYPANSLVDVPVTGNYSTPFVVSTHANGNACTGIAESNSGASWFIGSSGSNGATQYTTSSQAVLEAYSTSYNATGAALDSHGNAWSGGTGSSGIYEFPVSSNTTFFGRYTGMSAPVNPAVDGLNQVWMTNSSGNGSLDLVTSLNSSATVTSPWSGALPIFNASTLGLTSNSALAIDQGGNVWVPIRTNIGTYSTSGYIAEILGLAAPTIQPIALQEIKEYSGNTATDIRP